MSAAAPLPSGHVTTGQKAGKNPSGQPVLPDELGMLVATTSEAMPHVIERVIEGCQNGDQEAFRELFETHKDRVYSIALRYAGDPAVAMDIAQEVFVKLMSRIGQFRGDSSFESWLYRLVVNCCLDHRRRHKRLQPLLDEVLDLFRSPQQTPLEDLMRDEMQAEVRRVVAKLAPEQRIAVVLRYTEGLSYEEIAEATGCSRGTVASRLNRAHKILERRLRHARPGGNKVRNVQTRE
jgi:RNA polymerase sigma-70 factor (ECF subfamily)